MFKALMGGGRSSSSDVRSSSKSSRRRSDTRSVSSRKSSQGDEQNLTYPALGITSTEIPHAQKPESPRTLYKVGWGIRHQCDNLKQLVRDGTEQSSAILNELQRFELWATNLGLYHRGHSSLDYRCRDSPLIFNHALGLLRDLERALHQFQDSLLNPHEEDDDTNYGTDRHITNDQENLPGPDDSDEEDFSSYQTEPLTDAYLANIISTIDRLYSLAFKIRNPAMRLGMSKAAAYSEIDPETKADLIKEFEQIDSLHVEELFRLFGHPDPDPRHYLIRRLAKANTRRRQQFRYWNKRRARYEVLEHPQQPEITSREMEKQPASQSELPMVRPASETLKASTATWLDEKKVNLDDDASVVSSSSTVFSMSSQQDDERVGIPPPPTVDVSSKEFECPFCCIICPRKTLERKAWETHVFHDLRPYVCTFEDCPDPGQQYDSLHDWIGHEASVHLALGGQSESPSNPSRVTPQVRVCPFCQRQDVSISHIARHLRRIACFSLPRSSGSEGNATSNKGVSHGAQVDSDSSGALSVGSVYDDQDKPYNADPMPALDRMWTPKAAGDDETVQPLLNACSSGNYTLVQHLLEDGADINASDEDKRNALHTASESGHMEIVRLLLSYGAKVYAHDLHVASRKGYTEIVQLLLAHGADINACDVTDRNALYFASIRGHTEIAQLLINNGAYVNAQNGHGGNALQAVSKIGHSGIVQLLLASGADVDAYGEDGDNALQAASRYGFAEIVQLLLAHGADINAKSRDGGNAILAASRHGQAEIVQLLLAHGADVNAQSRDGENSLQAASTNGHAEIVQLLLAHGADVNAQSRDGGNALLAASRHGQAEIVELLLAHGADVDAQSRDGGNALQAAASINGHAEIIQLLLAHGADVHAQSRDGGNALHTASINGHKEIVQLLLAHGAEAITHAANHLNQPEDMDNWQEVFP